MEKARPRLIHSEGIPKSVFTDFKSALETIGLEIEPELRPDGPRSGTDSLLIPAAVVIFLSKPFIDGFLNRLANDANDYFYPKFKEAVSAVTCKTLEVLRGTSIAKTPGNVKDPEPQVLAITWEARDDRRVKCVLLSNLSEADCAIAVDKLFSNLDDHYAEPAREDRISKLNANKTSEPLVMAYDSELQTWKVIDPRSNDLP